MVSKATDVSWNNPLAAIWSSVEINTGILCSCLPTLKACVSRYFPRMFSTYQSHLEYPSKGTGGTHSTGGRKRLSLDAFGRSLGNKDTKGAQKSVIQSVRGGRDKDSDEIGLTSFGSMSKSNELEHGQIQVVTVLEQEEERARGSQGDSASTRDLVPRSFYDSR